MTPDPSRTLVGARPRKGEAAEQALIDPTDHHRASGPHNLARVQRDSGPVSEQLLLEAAASQEIK